MNPCGTGTELSLADFCSKQEENIAFEHVYVKKVRNSLSRTILFKELENLHGLEVDCFINHTVKELVVKLHAYTVGSHMRNIHVDHSCPENWWEAFKERWFPDWILRRWPLKYKVIRIHERIATKVCPHITIKGDHDCIAFLAKDHDR